MSAVTLATHDMDSSVWFYRALGFELEYGGAEAPFTILRAGASRLNLVAERENRHWMWWGRVIFQVSDVDAMYERAVSSGFTVDSEPADAEWGERYFHITDPDGHQLSFAKPIDQVEEQPS